MDGRLLVADAGDGRLSLEAVPTNESLFISQRSIVTSYPIGLVQLILDIKGPSWVCDEIARDENPNYVARYLLNDLLAYFDRSQLEGARILDFGCGSGASTAILAREFPEASIVGVELSDDLLRIAKARADHYGLRSVEFRTSASETELPDGLGDFDLVVMSAVYEHLLPPERPILLDKLWKVIRRGGCLFLDQTPHRYFPVELHTTYLPLINYLPRALALPYARHFSKRIERDADWPSLLRDGIRGGTKREIGRALSRSNSDVQVLDPLNGRDLIDMWLENTNPESHYSAKHSLAFFLSLLRKATGIEMAPEIAVAFRKI